MAFVACHREALSESERARVREELGREDVPCDSELDDAETEMRAARNGTAASMPGPEELVTQLLPFQQEGLAWMCAQEGPDSPVAGGVLADEMGMGKTIQAIALMLQRRNDTQTWRRLRASATCAPPVHPAPPAPSATRGSTLVVCPVSAMTQWATEITSRTLPGSLSVLVWHGSDRRLATSADLASYDVVITSYSVLEREWRRVNDRHKVSVCRACVRQARWLPGEWLQARQQRHAGTQAQTHTHTHTHTPRWRAATAARSFYRAP